MERAALIEERETALIEEHETETSSHHRQTRQTHLDTTASSHYHHYLHLRPYGEVNGSRTEHLQSWTSSVSTLLKRLVYGGVRVVPAQSVDNIGRQQQDREQQDRAPPDNKQHSKEDSARVKEEDSSAVEEDASAVSELETDDASDDEESIGGRRSCVKWSPSPSDVRVDPPKRYHDTWDSWQRYHRDYCERTMKVIPIRETMSRNEKNRRIQRTKGYANGTSALIPAEWDPYQRTYICTHGWGKAERGTGKRPRQYIREFNCPFRFVVQASQDLSGRWKLVCEEWTVHPQSPDHT